MTGRDITSEVVAKNSCALAQMIEFKPGSKAILSQCKTDTMDYEIYQSRGLDYFTNYKQAFWVKKIDCYHLIYTQDKMEIHCIKVN
ncbi:MAG: hypothetical protein MUE53_08335 [Chitinophagales bacterium]|jgi:hypothetical protein|nr:hypothetical protein [Chitinophagales bacterium]